MNPTYDFYENDQFELVSGCAIISKPSGKYIGSVCSGGIEWAEPSHDVKLAVSAFVGECAMNGIVFTSIGSAGNSKTDDKD